MMTLSNSIKAAILFLSVCLLVSVTAATSTTEVVSTPSMSLQQNKEYNWIWDMIVWLYDVIILAVIGPFFIFASLFGNCQSCYSNFVIGFMNTPFLRLSYKYV